MRGTIETAEEKVEAKHTDELQNDTVHVRDRIEVSGYLERTATGGM